MAIKVSQSVIDEIKKKGMSAALAHANSGSATTEFTEGAKRMYGNRVKGSGSEKNKSAEAKTSNRAVPSVGDRDSGGSKPREVKMPPSAPAAASRRTGGGDTTPTGNKTVEEVVAMRSKGKKSKLQQAVERKNAPVTGDSTANFKPAPKKSKAKAKKSNAWERAAR